MQSSRRCRTNETANSAAEMRGNARKQQFPVYGTRRCRDATTPQSCRLASAPFLFQQPTIPLQRPQPFDTSAVTSSFEPKLKRAATLHFSHTKMFFQIRPVSSPAMADSTLPPHPSYGATTSVSSPLVGFDQRLGTTVWAQPASGIIQVALAR